MPCFVVLEFGNRDFFRGGDCSNVSAPGVWTPAPDHRRQARRSSGESFRENHPALEEVLAKKEGKLYHHYEVHLFFTYLVFYTTLKVKEGCISSMVDFQVHGQLRMNTHQSSNSQHFQARIKAQFTVRPKCQCHPFRLLAGFLSESWHTRWAQKNSSYKYGYHSTSRGVIVPVIHLYTFKNKNLSRGAHNFI